MNQVRSSFAPGLVGVISGDLGRYSEFAINLLKLLVPEGSEWAWVKGNGFALNRNLIVQEKLKPHHEWLWFIDDDNTFRPDILMRLLTRKVDLIQPLVVTKKPPFQPYVYRFDSESGRYHTPLWDEIPVSGVSEWDAVATGGLLIQRSVLDAVGYPWFEEGKTSPDGLGEDLFFSTKAKQKGFRCFVDSDNRMGHMTPLEYWPNSETGAWQVGVKLDTATEILFPPHVGAREVKSIGAPPKKDSDAVPLLQV